MFEENQRHLLQDAICNYFNTVCLPLKQQNNNLFTMYSVAKVYKKQSTFYKQNADSLEVDFKNFAT